MKISQGRVRIDNKNAVDFLVHSHNLAVYLLKIGK